MDLRLRNAAFWASLPRRRGPVSGPTGERSPEEAETQPHLWRWVNPNRVCPIAGRPGPAACRREEALASLSPAAQVPPAEETTCLAGTPRPAGRRRRGLVRWRGRRQKRAAGGWPPPPLHYSLLISLALSRGAHGSLAVQQIYQFVRWVPRGRRPGSALLPAGLCGAQAKPRPPTYLSAPPLGLGLQQGWPGAPAGGRGRGGGGGVGEAGDGLPWLPPWQAPLPVLPHGSRGLEEHRPPQPVLQQQLPEDRRVCVPGREPQVPPVAADPRGAPQAPGIAAGPVRGPGGAAASEHGPARTGEVSLWALTQPVNVWRIPPLPGCTDVITSDDRKEDLCCTEPLSPPRLPPEGQRVVSQVRMFVPTGPPYGCCLSAHAVLWSSVVGGGGMAGQRAGGFCHLWSLQGGREWGWGDLVNLGVL